MERWIYTVEGNLAFPWDMLRYDGCYPIRPKDVENLHGREIRHVLLRGVREPTIERWESFGWYVNMVSPMAEE